MAEMGFEDFYKVPELKFDISKLRKDLNMFFNTFRLELLTWIIKCGLWLVEVVALVIVNIRILEVPEMPITFTRKPRKANFTFQIIA